MKELFVCVVLGSQFGDEGKGKLIDYLCNYHEVNINARCQGGDNAGHTIIIGKEKHVFHIMPSGATVENINLVIGNGCVIHLQTLINEINELKKKNINVTNRLKISDKAHIIFDLHRDIDRMKENELGSKSIGTTFKGIGPCYSSKMSRNGIRIGDLKNMVKVKEKLTSLVNNKKERFRKFNYDYDIENEMKKLNDQYEQIKEYIDDTATYINVSIKNKKYVLVEGAQSLLLDIDHGSYPYCTSSNCSIGGVLTGLGISPFKIDIITGVAKAYLTRVGNGYFPTEIFSDNPIQQKIITDGKEFGSTTGRQRRVGWYDCVMMKYSAMINGYTGLALMKIDILSGIPIVKVAIEYKYMGKSIPYSTDLEDYKENIEVIYKEFNGWDNCSNARKFSELPINAQTYIQYIVDSVNLPLIFIGVGPERSQFIDFN